MEILLKVQRGQKNPSSLLDVFQVVVYEICKLKRKQKGLLLIPKLQTWSVLFLSLFFTIGLPQMAPDLFYSFLDLGRRDLFILGWSVILGGVLSIWGLSRWSYRHCSPLLSITFFFYFLSFIFPFFSLFVSFPINSMK